MDRRQSFYKWYCQRQWSYKSCGRDGLNLQLIVRYREVSSFKKSLLTNDGRICIFQKRNKVTSGRSLSYHSAAIGPGVGNRVIKEKLQYSKLCLEQTLIECEAYKRTFGDYRSRMTTT